MNIRMIAVMTGAALAITTLAGAQAAEVKLKAASFLPKRVIIATHFYKWVDVVNKQCAGKLKISVIGPAAIKSLEQWNALKSGVVDMHYGPANYYKGTMPGGDVFILARNEPSEQRKNGAWAMINKLHNDKMNAWYLTNLTGGVQFFLYTTKPAKGARFDGFRLRSVPIYDGFFRSLGAQPVRMPPPAVYTALERGTVDGYGWPSWGLRGFGFDKHTKYRYGPGFFSAASPILVNLDIGMSLAGDQRKCLTDMAGWLESEWPKWRAAEHTNQMAIQDRAGIKYVDLGADFANRAENLYWAELEKANPAFVTKIRPLLAPGS